MRRGIWYFSFSVEGGEKLKELEDEDEGEPEREFVAADEFDESDIDDIEDMHEGRGSAKFRTLFSPLSCFFLSYKNLVGFVRKSVFELSM